MKTRADSPSWLPLLITSVAVILFGVAGFVRMMGWGPASIGDFGSVFAHDRVASAPERGEARARPGCPECGMIESVREIETHDEHAGPGAAGGATAGNRGETRIVSTRKREIIVRMADGSSRALNPASAANWRTGEWVIIIDGASPSNR